MTKTAIIFSGSAYNIRFSLQSLLDNLIIPNNADVFVVTTRGCKRRKTPPTNPIPDCDVDWDAYVEKNAKTIVDETPLTDAELQLIRDTFGERLKALHVFEEMPEYYEYVLNDRIKMMEVQNSYIDEGRRLGISILPNRGNKIYDSGTGSIRYVIDQYHHAKKCYEVMEQYEKEHGFKYHYVMRARIDFKCPEVINLHHYAQNHDEPYLYVFGSVRRDPFFWADEFAWFSKRPTATKIFPALDRMGLITDRKYDTVYKPQHNDFRFSPETQFDLLLHELNLKIINVRIYRSAEYTAGNDGYDYFNYRFKRYPPIDLDYEYKLVCECKTDINEHLHILHDYAAQCDLVVELGVRYGNSTVAMMAGKPKKMISYDTYKEEKVEYLEWMAKENGLNWEIKIMNPTPEDGSPSLLPDDIDLLFIDTNHYAQQMELELRLHAHKVKRWIIMHDTEIFWNRGSGDDHLQDGLKNAVEPFLEKHKGVWQVEKRLSNNNGLLILKRINGN